MVGYVVTFFIIVIMAGVLAFSDISATVVDSAYILLLVGLALAIFFIFFGNRRGGP